MANQSPRVPEHVPVNAAFRRGQLRIGPHRLEDHTVWVATDDLGVVALAGSREALLDALAGETRRP
jgi:hypothetical protein